MSDARATQFDNVHIKGDLQVDGSIVGETGDAVMKLTEVASAVNEFTATNAATGSGPTLAATGTDTNIPVTLKGKGTGAVILGQATSTGVQLVADQPMLDSSGNELVKFTKSASAVNELTVKNAAAGFDVELSATGGDTNIDLQLLGKGTGIVLLGATASATSTSSAATVNAQRGYVTSEALTTAAGAAWTVTLTNNKIAVGSQVVATVENGTNTQGIPVVAQTKVTGAGTATIAVYNLHASQALNGTILVSFAVL